MGIPVNPQVLKNVPGWDADKVAIPETTPLDSATPSIKSLFPQITSVPLTSGGLPVERTGMNGLLNLFGQFIYLYQSGVFPEYNEEVNYLKGSMIRDNNELFFCIQDNGPETEVHGTDESDYWLKLDATSFVPVGTVISYAGATVPSGYLLCDGSSKNRADYPKLFSVIGTTYGSDDLATFRLPRLTDGRFIEGASVAGEYKSAGLPTILHTHAGSADSAGAHTHGRGNMDITGRVGCSAQDVDWAEGAFYRDGQGYESPNGHYDNYITRFKASRSWTGRTSSDGAHTHDVSVGNNTSVSAIYGNSLTVQPQSLGLIYIIKF